MTKHGIAIMKKICWSYLQAFEGMIESSGVLTILFLCASILFIISSSLWIQGSLYSTHVFRSSSGLYELTLLTLLLSQLMALPFIHAALLPRQHTITALKYKCEDIESNLELLRNDLSPRLIKQYLSAYDTEANPIAKLKFQDTALAAYSNAINALSEIRAHAKEIESPAKKIAQVKLSENAKSQVHDLALNVERSVRQAAAIEQELNSLDLSSLKDDEAIAMLELSAQEQKKTQQMETDIARAEKLLVLQNLSALQTLESLDDDGWQALLNSRQSQPKAITDQGTSDPDGVVLRSPNSMHTQYAEK